MRRFLALLSLLAAPAAAAGPPGQFDYYVLSLSWPPTWCALEGDARRSPQCDPGTGFGWILHGLWPQHETGYPEYCAARTRDPGRAETAAMADIMGTAGLAWYQWKKHGRCAGLPPQAYFAAARRAFESVAKPQVFRRLDAPVRLPARVVEEAFLEDNPALFPDAVTITCKSGRVQEARVCLSRDDLAPRPCGSDVIRDCVLPDALLDPIE